MKLTVPVLLVLFLCLFAATYTSAAQLTVTKTEDTNDGVCDADCSLREAVAAAASGDTVVFSSLFNSPQTITLSGVYITISKNLTINGAGRDLVTISGNNSSRIFLITAGVTVTLSGMTFRDGHMGASDPYGSAVVVGVSTLNVSNATFTSNSAGGAGGAIFGAENSIITLSNLVVVGNSSQGGGSAISGYSIDIRDSLVSQNTGGGVGSNSTANIERCAISDNTEGGVGGRNVIIKDSTISNNNTLGGVGGNSLSTITIERCLISGNTRIRGGGGVDSAGMTTVKDSQITNNTAVGVGGGIRNEGTFYLINSNVSGNTVSPDPNIDAGGGGIMNYRTLFVINSTVSGNTAMGAPGVGGGVYTMGSSNNHGRVYLINSTIANNTSVGAGGGINIGTNGEGNFSNSIVTGNNSTGTTQEDVFGPIMSNGINLIGNASGSSGWILGDLLNLNPLLASLGNNGGSTLTHALLPGSPAIDAGNNALAVDPQTMLPLGTDQRGGARFTGGKIPTVDIGAFEASYSSSPVTVSGRITTYSGRGIERTRIKIDNGDGNISYAQTNPFGYFRFVGLTPGTTYTITVTHKFYLFTSPQSFTADQNRSDLNFMTGL